MLLQRPISCRERPTPCGGILQTQLQTGARLFVSGKRTASCCRAEARRGEQPETEAAKSPWSRHLRRLAASGLTVAGTAAVAMPGAAIAAELSGVSWPDMYWASVGVGVSCALLTVWATSRFLLSFFPELEKKGHCLPWRLLTACDPVLLPLQRGLFQMEPGDLHFGAVVLLGITVSLLESLVGDGGLWLEKVPDLDLLAQLQYLVFCGHCLLLPTWVLVLLRTFAVL